jgi:hypothetical protein
MADIITGIRGFDANVSGGPDTAVGGRSGAAGIH